MEICDSRATRQVVGILLCSAAAAFGLPKAAFGFALWAVKVEDEQQNPLPLSSDLLANPNHFYSYDVADDPITWRFTPEFLELFSPAERNQVRLAFAEWQNASASISRRSDIARYGWTRYIANNYNFYDLRSVVTHEIGHALGAQHPDASWFNPFENAPLQRNFRPDGQGGLMAAPPIGREIMNEGFALTLPDAKADRGLRRGEYTRKLSKDELDMLDYSYGRPLKFVQVASNDNSANIVVDVFEDPIGNCGSGGALGQGAPSNNHFTLNDPQDALQGATMERSFLKIHRACSQEDGPPIPVGIAAKPLFWEITNTSGQDARGFTFRSIRTDNTDVVNQTSLGLNRFTEYTNLPTPNIQDSLELVRHQWTKPTGGAFPDGTTVEVGLQLDVWDWLAVDPQLIITNDLLVPAATQVVQGFFGQGQIQQNDLSGQAAGSRGLVEGPVPNFVVKGLKLSNDTSEPMTIDQIVVSPLGNRPGSFDDLRPALLEELRLAGLTQTLDVRELVLQPEDEFFVILEGTADDLPPELLAQGNFLIDPRPGLLDEQLLVYSLSHNSSTSVGSYTFINSPILTAPVPEPASLPWLLAAACAAACRRKHLPRRRHRQPAAQSELRGISGSRWRAH